MPVALLVALLAIAQNPSRAAQADRAETALRRGDHAEAKRLAATVTRAYEGGAGTWSSSDRVAAARAYVVLGAEDPQALRRAVAAFDAAIAADSSNLDARLRLGDLFLAKYNAPDARDAYDGVLRRAPEHPAALLGIARVHAFEGRPDVLLRARQAVAGNPALVGGHVLIGWSHLEAEAMDSALAAAGRALAVDSTSVDAWAVRGAVAWVRGDSTEFNRIAATARRHVPRPAGFYADVAEAAARQRRYADAVRLARLGVALDSLSAKALGALGTNELRTGELDAGRAHLERAFALDPFHVWNKNTLDMLDELRTFRTARHGRFTLVTPPHETDLLTLYMAPLLEEAHARLSARYGYAPPEPIRLEMFNRHADFSVRTVGLAGLGALGVSFGSVLAMDAPSARPPGEFNWGSTAWHELAHAFTLGMSDHRVPRWLSEGLSVLEERHARPGWGADASLEFLAALGAGRLRPVSSLNDGFVRPAFPGEVQVSYYQASLVCEMIEAERGVAPLVALLVAFRDGLDARAALQRALGVTPEAFDKQFTAWLAARFPRAAATSEFVQAIETGRVQMQRGAGDSGRAAFTRAQQIFPDYGGEDGPAWYLAQLARASGDLRGAVAQLVRITTRDETALAANRLEADLQEQLGNPAGAIAALERVIWIAPQDVAVHRRLAALAERGADYTRAVRERRAVVALHPADPLEARYELARAFMQAGDRAAARREVLAVLEQAPGYEKAQLLLLELRGAAMTRGLWALTALLSLAAPVAAQREGVEVAPNVAYDGRFTFVRIRYAVPWQNGIRVSQDVPWSHDYSRAERHFTRILSELSTLRVRTDASNVMVLDDPDLFKYPIAYLCEPGFWNPSDSEVAALRAYLLKGGFLIVDDFAGNQFYNFEEQMRRVLPEGRLVTLTAEHPIFDSFYHIPTLDYHHPYWGQPSVFYGVFEQNDPSKRLLMIVNFNNDVAEYWEFSDTGMFPIDLSNDAYKLGVNYVMYALTR